MAAVNVTLDALNKVKNSIANFRLDTSDFSGKIRNHIYMAEDDCKEVIKSVEHKLSNLKEDIIKNENELNKQNEKLIENQKEIEYLESKNFTLDDEIIGLEIRKARLEEAIDSAYDNCMSLEWRTKNLKEAYAHFYGCDSVPLSSQIESLRYEIKSNEYRITGLKFEKEHLQSEINEAECELSKMKAEKARLDDIYPRLKIAWQKAEEEMIHLNDTVKCFNREVHMSTAGNISGIDKCMEYVEDYLATNL